MDFLSSSGHLRRIRLTAHERHRRAAQFVDTTFHQLNRLNREDATFYLQDRARKGFTVIQAVALAELDGLKDPNPYGHRPLTENDGPGNDDWNHVDFIAETCGKGELARIVRRVPSYVGR